MAGKRTQTKRTYDSSARTAAAQATRRTILEAARRLLIGRGYGAMTMAAVAREAGVALDTVYAAVGRKPKLMALLVETALSGGDEAVPAQNRDYVRRIRATQDAAAKLAVYASAIRGIHARLAPIVQAVREAGRSHPELARLWKSIAGRRRRNMSEFAADLLATGQVRCDLDQEAVADVLWTMGAPEFYSLMVGDASWSPERFERWLADAWQRLLLAAGTGGAAGD